MNDARDRMERFVSRTWDAILANAARGLDQVKTPLYRNAFYILLTTIVGSGLGLFFWIVAYRFYQINDAGYAITMVNTATFLAAVASLGLPIALIRFLPETDDPTALINSALTVSGVVAAVLSFVFMLGIPLWAPGLAGNFARPDSSRQAWILVVVITTMAYAFGMVLDQAAIAARRADLFFWRIVMFSITKIPLPVFFVIWFKDPLGGVMGIYLSWSIAYGITVLVAGFLFLPRVIPGYRPRPRFSRRRLRPMFAFTMGNWSATMIGSAGGLLLPLIIINALPAASAAKSTAVYYAASTFAAILSVIPGATMTSLYAEASQKNAQRRTDERRAIVLSLALLAPGILAMWVFGDRLLGLLFDLDPRTVGLAAGLPQLLSLASIPVFLNSVYSTRVRVLKKTAPLIVSAAIATVVTLALGYLFLLSYGLFGLAAAVVLGQAAATPYLFRVAGKPMEPEKPEPIETAPVTP